jgi:hypothetical protein
MTDTPKLLAADSTLNQKRFRWPRILTFETCVFTFVIVFLLVDRIRLWDLFGFRYADEDQALLWYATTEVFRGRFHEPCFYGQPYNTVAESILAVPLYAVGVPLPNALSIVTTLLGLFPFILFSWMSWKRGLRSAAILIMLVPLVLNLHYGIVISIPRGFVTGLACTAVVAALLFARDSVWKWILAGFLSVLAINLNPNCVLLLGAVILYAWLGHWKSIRFYASTLGGALLGSPIPLAIASFYRNHPTYDTNPHPPLEFTWKTWQRGIDRIDMYFGHFVPWQQSSPGSAVVAILCGMVIVLVCLAQWRAALSFAAAVGACVISLGINRIHDSDASIFLSGSRMFIAIPTLYALGIFWICQGLGKWQYREIVPRIAVGLLVAMSLFILIPRQSNYSALVRDLLWKRVLSIYLVEDCKNQCREIEKVADAEDAHLVLFSTHRDKTMVYALPAFTGGRCQSLLPPFDRRSWLLEQETFSSHTRILVYVENLDNVGQFYQNARNNFDDVRVVGNYPRLLSVAAEGQSAIEVARKLGINVRRY